MIQKLEALATKQAKAAVRYPHHYKNALLMTLASACMGEVRISVIGFFWLYALGENFFDDGEKQHGQRE